MLEGGGGGGGGGPVVPIGEATWSKDSSYSGLAHNQIAYSCSLALQSKHTPLAAEYWRPGFERQAVVLGRPAIRINEPLVI